MFDIKLTGHKPVKDTFVEMSVEELIDFTEKEYTVKSEILDEADELDQICIGLQNKQAIIETRNNIPTDPLWVHYSLEAWTLNESIKKVLEKFKQFFPKVFNYIGSFVVIRTKASLQQVEKWLLIIKDQNKDQDKIDKIFNDSTVKTAKVETIANALNSAASAYAKLSDQANQIKGFKGVGQSDADKQKLQDMFAFPKEYQTFLDNKKLVDDATPSKEDAGTAGFTYKDGGWDDPSKIAKIVDALQHVTSVLENLKRLQAICNEMIRSLEKEDKGESSEQKLVKELNNEKIKFLRDFSKKVLSGMMGAIGQLGSMAAFNCRSFCNKYSNGEDK